MLMLLASVGDDRYALDVRHVVEVVPAVEVDSLPGAPPHVAGVIDYRGNLVPVVDLSRLVSGRQCRNRLSTRIILMDYPPGKEPSRRIGLRAEGVMETLAVPPAEVESAKATFGGMPCLHRNLGGRQEIIACLDLEQLLGESLHQWLCCSRARAV